MSDNVIPLAPRLKAPVGEVSQLEEHQAASVAMFEELLKEAREGKISHAMVVYEGGEKEDRHVGGLFTQATDAITLIGMAAFIQHQIQEQLSDEMHGVI